MDLLDRPLTFSQGKVAELRQELTNSGKKDKNHAAKKNALKKIVANMTMSNNDMVALFPDVINCMDLPVLEIKKMFVRHGVKLASTDTVAGVFCTSRTMQGRSPRSHFAHCQFFRR
jgi:hypothetical protein